MVGFIFLLLATATGGAIDLSNAVRQRAIAQKDLDAALLSTFRNKDTETMTAAERESLVRTYMNRTFTDFPADADIAVSVEDDTYTATLEFDSKNSVMRVFGVESYAVGVQSSVTFGPPRPMELSLVLDTTSSMDLGDKMPTMKDAARDLVTTLTEFDTVRIALVPFARHINVGMANRSATGLDIPADEPDTQQCSTTPDMAQTNCRDENSTCSNESCSTYMGSCTSDGVSKSCEKSECTQGPSHACMKQVCDQEPTGTSTTTCDTIAGEKWEGCVGSREYPANTRDSMAGGPVPGFLGGYCAPPVMRLTTDGASIVSAIDAFTPGGETFIAPALLWGARMISAQVPFPDGTAAGGAVDMQKVIVLMSDGANTVSKIAGSEKHQGTDRTDSDNLLLEVCTNLKAQDIVIVTVAYDIDDAGGRSLLQECATDESTMFFDARTDAELIDSFASITRGFRVARVSQ